jgi:hypothetical protein
MIWVIVIGIVVYIAYRFLRDLNKDKADLRDKDASEKFSIVAGLINEAAFNNNGEITVLDNREFTLYEGKNQMVRFIYSTGNLTIIWKYKYFQKEVTHERVFRNVRNLSIFEQEGIGKTMIEEMHKIIVSHQQNVINVAEMTGIKDETKEEFNIGAIHKGRSTDDSIGGMKPIDKLNVKSTNNRTKAQAEEGERLLNEALRLSALGRDQESMVIINSMIDRSLKLYEALSMKAWILFSKEEFESARKIFLEIAEFYSDKVTGFLGVGLILVRASLLQKAIMKEKGIDNWIDNNNRKLWVDGCFNLSTALKIDYKMTVEYIISLLKWFEMDDEKIEEIIKKIAAV